MGSHHPIRRLAGTTHAELTRNHRPAHVRRKMRVWTPTALAGVAIWAAALMAGHVLALLGAGMVVVGLLGLIEDHRKGQA